MSISPLNLVPFEFHPTSLQIKLFFSPSNHLQKLILTFYSNQMVQVHRRITPQITGTSWWSHQASLRNSHNQKCNCRRFRKISLRSQQLRGRWKCRNRLDSHRSALSLHRADCSNHRLRTTSYFHMPLLRKSNQNHALDERWQVYGSHWCDSENWVGEEGRQGNVSMRHQKRSGERTSDCRTQAWRKMWVYENKVEYQIILNIFI